MKLSNFLMGTLVCAMAAACTNDTYEGGNENNQTGNGEQAFIAVRLTAPNAMTRAFEDGSADENAVTTARFYFFDDSDNAVNVSTYNYIDESSPSFTTPTNDENGNIEETTSATILVLENEAEWPTQMVVVLNPPSSLNNASKSLSGLKAAMDCSGESNGSFIMSNSVYADTNGAVDAVNISNHIATTSEAAQGNPVTVYVERVLARVDVACTNDLETDKKDGTGQSTSTINGLSSPTTDTEVKATILNWTIANRNSQSHLLKSLNNWTTSSTINTWAATNWNDANSHRSYWAYTGDITAQSENDSYNDIYPNAETAFATKKYCQENTGTTSPTEIVVVAQLTVDNQPVSIAKYAGQYWTADNLLTQFANQILNGQIYYKASNGEPTSATTLPASALMFRPGKSSETNVKAYQAVLDLKSDYSTGYTFYSDNGTTEINVTDVQDILNDYVVLLWHEGKTYYHTTIDHTLNSHSVAGVVRNHLYKINLTGVTGLGTPIPGVTSDDPDDQPDDPDDPDPDVPDPEDKPIDPEDPDEEESFLAAEINILSWNVISQDVTLGGNN